MDANKKRQYSEFQPEGDDAKRSQRSCSQLRTQYPYTDATSGSWSFLDLGNLSTPDQQIELNHESKPDLIHKGDLTMAASAFRFSSQYPTANTFFPQYPLFQMSSYTPPISQHSHVWNQGQNISTSGIQDTIWDYCDEALASSSQVCNTYAAAQETSCQIQIDSQSYNLDVNNGNNEISTVAEAKVVQREYAHASISQQDVVCFGMLIDIAATCHVPPTTNQLQKYLVKFQDAANFSSTCDANITGKLNHEFANLMLALLDEPDLQLEIYASLMKPTKPISSRYSSRQAGISMKCSLDIIIYGLFELFDEIGDFFEEREVYLQDPIGCSRNVPYFNPHRLPARSSSIVYTANMEQNVMRSIEKQDVHIHPELLDILDSQEDLAETEQPLSIKTKLARHQKQALTFMQRREHGWVWDGSSPDIWEAVESGQETFFLNRISNTTQTEEPLQFYGGIIADPMGLGKTLSMIALIACDMHLDYRDLSTLSHVDTEDSSGRTLVIVPPPLLISWEEQFKEHIAPNSLPWCHHYAKSRLTDASQLESTMIVLTTYHTVATEWKNGSGIESSMLFKTRWKRIVLDEAHIIRNSESQISRAICSLDAVSRWAVTGTPIQNKLGDLTALLKFLKVYPYSEKKIFEADISHMWKSGSDEEAVRRLKRLSGCLLLRRPKGTINLPPRQDHQLPVEFTAAERQFYEEIKTQVIAHINETLMCSGNSSRPNSFVNVLQRIEAMRMVCNLGLRYPSRHNVLKQSNSDPREWQDAAQEAFNMRRNMGQIQCDHCSSILDGGEHLLGDATQSNKALFYRCISITCSSCAENTSKSGKISGCGHEPSCPVAVVSLDNSWDAIQVEPIYGNHPLEFPTKVKALLNDLQKLPGDVKCVVFSTWRMTLDVVKAALDHASIPSVRFDGTVQQKDRQNVVDRFRNDPTIRVMLLTLSCGAVGLTLTAASRAYLMEPHWNPTLEDQALARIHRMGQTREVTTVRFYVRNSFEERVIEAQESKRDLAAILLNPQGRAGGGGESDMLTKPLEWLRGLI